MERVRCPQHGSLCFLKTGVRDGPSKGRSFYVCRADACGFVRTADIPVSHCLLHEDFVVELQGLFSPQGTKEYKLFFRCTRSKAEGKHWCGNIPWQEPDSKEHFITTKLQDAPEPFHHPSNQPRNPFKVLDKNQELSLWKQFIRGEGEEKTADKEEREDQLSEQKKERKPESKPWKEKGLPSHVLIKSKQSTIQEKEQAGRTEPRGEAKEAEGTHSRDLPGTTPAQCHGNELRKPSVSPKEKANGESRDIPKESEPRREKETKLLPLNVHSQNPISKHQKEGQVSTQHPKNWETREPPAVDGPGTQAVQEKLPPLSFQAQLEPPDGMVAPKGPAPQSAPPAAGPALGERRGAAASSEDSKEEDVVFVASGLTLGSQKESLKLPTQSGQREVTPASGVSKKEESSDSAAHRAYLTTQLKQKKTTLASVNIQALPDKGQKLFKQIQVLEDVLSALTLCPDQGTNAESNAQAPQQCSVIKTTSEPPRLVPPKALQAQELQPQSSLGLQAACQVPAAGSSHRNGGHTDHSHFNAKWKIISDAIDELHRSLESCPSETAVAEGPAELKVPLLLHQKQALAWLLWRESQKPRGGILADDMGLGKTLTMIALILTQKNQEKNKEKDKNSVTWLSKDVSSDVASHGTLIICPASLIHHWKKEVERHVSNSRLRVYLYHGPNRHQHAEALSRYDIVITTYSLMAKEIPTKKQEGEIPGANLTVEKKQLQIPGLQMGQELSDNHGKSLSGSVLSGPRSISTPLLRIVWARIVLDEAHNIKNPRVQTSIAACKLQARARWAVTGTPIQNNLLDMYSLLKFLRCSPFDDFNLWKSQVDNGTKKGGERLSILIRSLLLRRTKDQLDPTGKPLVMLPQRKFQLHHLKLSEDEESVYNVFYARSRSALQSYLKRHTNGYNQSGQSPSNPFSRVAQEFGPSGPGYPVTSDSQRSSTAHILSQLLRLRQCCCHLSLLKSVRRALSALSSEQLLSLCYCDLICWALDPTELKSEGLVLSLEEQLSALTLSELQSSESSSTVSLNGTCFKVELFEDTRKSTKISSLLAELEAIQRNSGSQKSVIVSQWTCMLRVVALHLKRHGLTYATIDGSVNPKQRMDLVEAFNSKSRGPQVMLISLLAGGVGLNLTGGNHLFLLDMHWNPSLEDQACDRIYRVGQQKDVVIHRFVCEGTVEEKILQLQEKKKDLAKQVLSGTGESVTKLTLADLKVLFGI